MKKVGVGIIGCGGRVRGLAKMVVELGEGIEVVALSDPNPLSIEAAQKAFAPEAKVYEDYEELVNDPAVDWVMIGSWNCYHAAQTIAAFEAGKHVFCEKPLALTIEDGLAMREAWKTSGCMFSIGFTLRYSPHYRRIKQLVGEGRIGQIISFEYNEHLDFNHGGYIHADWRRKTEWAGSHLLEKCCHDLDIINWITGSYAVRAASFGGCDFFVPANAWRMKELGANTDGRPAFTTWSHDGIQGNVINPFNDDKDILDNQVVIMEYASGCRATFHTNCCVGLPERRLYLCGTEGTIRSDVIKGEIQLKRIGFDTEIETLDTWGKDGHGGGDSVLCASLAESMQNGAAPLTSIEDGLAAAITAFGVDQAQRTQQVTDLRPLWAKIGRA